MKPSRVTLHTVCGLEELPGHGGGSVSHVLSILDPGWPEPDFADYGAARRTVLRFHDAIAPGPGLVLPQMADIAAILAFGREAAGAEGADERAHVLVHCHLGLSRSTAALAAIFAQSEPEMPAADLIARLHDLREPAWPNARMIAFADEALGRGGSLVEAVRRLHGVQLRKRPHLDALMRELGRGAEVDAALSA